MSDLRKYPDALWDRLFDLLYPCDEATSDEEIRADLQNAGIDMRPAYKRMHQMIEVHRARERFAQSEQVRASLIGKMKEVVLPQVENLRQGIASLIKTRFNDSAQIAHFQKLDKTSDEDLQSLLHDLMVLAAIQEKKSEDGSKAE